MRVLTRLGVLRSRGVWGLLGVALLASACGGSDEPLRTGTTLAATTSSTTTSTAPPTTTSSTTTTTTISPAATTAAPTTKPAEPTVAELYAANCALCHGDNLEGGTGPALGPDGHAHGHSDEELLAIVTNGKGDMPGFAETLTDQQITGLIAFIRGVDVDA